ncbi:MAG: hypothetical protein A2919_02110 [Candidatus Spechtbacteria bacterium RIFCSPLOWO2_01_FULL_43_12]|uniref:Uncharacterized protein n=1 Tax=Candidatus Spechtbacteria bacterium RIFCSPLOWO2_01_FULL_43_12 TaxID=1802162 RepID=A0A1G2HEF2_9BACT|nr:MAG: hypothetical protein A2919_02110 [Candidatus Spechtbacteria bacterium RIFCSPLOWO2_01_FULL_43_12]
MKKKIYIGLFAFLGFLSQFIVHGAVEWFYIRLLMSDFEKWSFGWDWNTWLRIHHISSLVLVLAGVWFGYTQGKYWWNRIYVLKDAWFQNHKPNKMIIFAKFFIVFIFITLVLAVLAVYNGNNLPQEQEPVFCTQDAKLCPDGSYVGRTGPNCEFADCPATEGLFLE